jgi:hypothetical protein
MLEVVPVRRYPKRSHVAALQVVAMQVVADAVESYVDGAWERYPEIGEADWVDVVGRARWLAVSQTPGEATVSRALQTLADRASEPPD